MYILCMEPPSWVERLHTWLETHLDGFSPASDRSDWEPYRSLILSPTNTTLYKLFNIYTKPPMPIVDCSSSHNAGRPNCVPLLPQLNIWSQSYKIHKKKLSQDNLYNKSKYGSYYISPTVLFNLIVEIKLMSSMCVLYSPHQISLYPYSRTPSWDFGIPPWIYSLAISLYLMIVSCQPPSA